MIRKIIKTLKYMELVMSVLLLDFLRSTFDTDTISRADFRRFLDISETSDWRMFKSGQYPRVIRLGNQDKILLIDLANWLEQGGSASAPTPKRGSRNKSKTTVLNVPQ